MSKDTTTLVLVGLGLFFLSRGNARPAPTSSPYYVPPSVYGDPQDPNVYRQVNTQRGTSGAQDFQAVAGGIGSLLGGVSGVITAATSSGSSDSGSDAGVDAGVGW